MNAGALEKLISEAITTNVFLNWRFYVLMVCFGILTSIIASYIDGWSKKKGETAAVKADLEEIKRQLKETTTVAKTVETAIVRSDWLQREKNVLKRAKLEALVRGAFSVAAWGREQGSKFSEARPIEHSLAVDEFRMLAILYFPEIKQSTDDVSNKYIDCIMMFGNIRSTLIQYDNQIRAAEAQNNHSLLVLTRKNRAEFVDSKITEIVDTTHELTMAAHRLGSAAQKVMEQLTTAPSES